MRLPNTARSASEILLSLSGCVVCDTRGGRASASNFGLTELALDFVGVESPAMGEVGFAVLPTYSPEGNFPVLFLPDALPSIADGVEPPGAPDAPRCPSGVAAKFPRRLPATGAGGAPAAGCRLSAIMPPPLREPPGALTEGGGAITRGACPRSAAERP